MRFFRRPKTPAELLARIALAAAAVLVAFIGYTAWQFGRTVTAVSSDPLRDLGQIVAPAGDRPASQPGVAGALARGERVNILLLGYGGAGHDGAFLTDSLMLASINGRSGVVTLVSVPRDLWVTFPKNKYSGSFQGKVNGGFSIAADNRDRDEGMRIAAETLRPILGVAIDHTIALDFRAFRTVVDQIGGIDLMVDRSFTSIYPRNDDSNIDSTWIDVSFKAGPQHMDGETALRYARARYADGPEGSDFARSSRQQKVILATKDKVTASGAASQLLGLLDALRDNVRTDLSLADMRALGDFARSYDDSLTVRGALTIQNVLQNYGLQVSDGIAATLQPRVEGWSEVQAYVRRLVEYPDSLVENPLVRVSASARFASAGQAAANLLKEIGFRAEFDLATGDDPAVTQVSGGSPESVAALASFFGTTGTSTPGAVTVRIGRDWVPPRPFLQRALSDPVPTASSGSSASPSPRPSSSASPSPRPSSTATPAPRPSASPARTG